MGACPFCAAVSGGRQLHHDGELVAAFNDHYPSSEGHVLVVPRRHVGRLSELTGQESAALWQVAMEQLRRLEHQHVGEAFTVGVNDGAAAGQTVAHVHLHVIPRVEGDVDDPRGGVRRVLPGTAHYWDS